MGDGKKKFLLMDFIALIIFLGFILIIFNLKGIFFIGEFILLCLFILITLISLILIYNNVKFGWGMLGVLLFLMLLDLLLIYTRVSKIGIAFLVTLFVTAIAFIIALVSAKKEEIEEVAEEVEEEKPVVSKKYTPGKYIASKMGKSYHSPKCDWAKNIKEKNRVWFDDDKEAKKAGYKKHSCLK